METRTRKEWKDMSNEEKKASYDSYEKNKLIEAHKTTKAPWQRDMTAKEVDDTIPYNASSGKTYSRDISMLLRAEMTIKGYEKPQFLTMEEGNFMGGVLKFKVDENGEIQKTASGKDARVEGVKNLYLKTYELRNKLDRDGNPIMVVIKDKEGNPIIRKDGSVLEKAVQEKINIQPTLETQTLYHISQFDGLNESKLKERDLTSLHNFREQLKDKPYEIKPNFERIGLGGNLAKQLEHFALSQIKGIDYYNPIIYEKSVNNTKEQAVEQTQEATKTKSRKAKAKEQDMGNER